MKIAVSTDSGKVSAHFGRCPEFTIAKIEDGEVKNKEVIENPGHRPGYLPKFMNEKQIDCIVSGGMGRKAISMFNDYEIEAITGINGNVDEVLEEMAEGEIEGSANPCKPGGGKGYGVEKEDEHHH
ncbi:MAG: NifB/NifX family molybdenum-iron cluster-binding protein [Candidatus Aenigmatarchaeota archaeon]